MHLPRRNLLMARLLLLPALAALLLAGCGSKTATPSSNKPTISIADNTFETGWINNAIAAYILQTGYGYTTTEIVLTTPGMQTALARGDVDVAVEFWPGNMQDWWDAEIAKGSIVDLGDVYEGGDQFFMIPKTVADQHNLKSIEDMKRPEVVKLFPNPENPKKGAFINCIIGWQCAEINRAKFKAYGLDQFYDIISPGSSAAMDAAIVGPIQKQQPVFAYYFSPTSIKGGYDWQVLQEPTFSEKCWAEVIKGRDDKNYTPKEACAYATQRTLKVSTKAFPQKAPEAAEFFKKMYVGIEPLNKTAAWAKEHDIQGQWQKAAVYYLNSYEDRWKTWVPADVHQKVKQALAQAK